MSLPVLLCAQAMRTSEAASVSPKDRSSLAQLFMLRRHLRAPVLYGYDVSPTR